MAVEVRPLGVYEGGRKVYVRYVLQVGCVDHDIGLVVVLRLQGQRVDSGGCMLCELDGELHRAGGLVPRFQGLDDLVPGFHLYLRCIGHQSSLDAEGSRYFSLLLLLCIGQSILRCSVRDLVLLEPCDPAVVCQIHVEGDGISSVELIRAAHARREAWTSIEVVVIIPACC